MFYVTTLIELFFGHLQATHFALAFEVPGWNNEKEAVIATVLQVPKFNVQSNHISEERLIYNLKYICY